MKNKKDFLLDIFFPKTCINCKKEGNYLCEDCKAIIEISEHRYCLCPEPKRISHNKGKCQQCEFKLLNGLYFATSYHNVVVQKLIKKFKYNPFIKELAEPLAFLIITHIQLIDKRPNFSNYLLVPVPLTKKREKWRGFNQAGEIAKQLSKFLKIPLLLDCLIRPKETLPQVTLSQSKRQENIKGAFLCQRPKKINNRKILLVDDIYTTGSTMEEVTSVLKKSGAQEVWGITIARE